MARSTISGQASGSALRASAGVVDKWASDRLRTLDRTARWGAWALPVWAVLLFRGTVTHQPDTRSDFPGFAGYVTTAEFLISHIVASIFGAGIGALGFIALFVLLAVWVTSTRRAHINGSGAQVRLALSDGTQRIVAPWSMTRIDASVTIVHAEPTQLSGDSSGPEDAA